MNTRQGEHSVPDADDSIDEADPYRPLPEEFVDDEPLDGDGEPDLARAWTADHDKASSGRPPAQGTGPTPAAMPAAAPDAEPGPVAVTAGEPEDATAAAPPAAPEPAAPEPGTVVEPSDGATVAEPATDSAGDEPAAADSAGDGPDGDKPADDLDPFIRFAPAPEEVPSRARQITDRVGRVLGHEWTLASLGGLLLAIVMTWPTLRYPLQTIPQDVWDPTLQAWEVAWAGHALTTSPLNLWHANAFWPDQYSYVFSDTLLGYAPFALIGQGPAAAVLRYNILFVLAYALAFVGAYALVRQLGSTRTGAVVAGVAFAYAPWRLAQAGHLHVMSSGGIVLALAMLARGHGYSLRDGYRPERRHAGWALGGWLVGAWQLTLGFGIGLPFGYIVGVIVIVSAVTWAIRRTRVGPRPFGGRLLLADLGGGALFGAVALLMALPYLKVVELHPEAKRSEAEVALYSSPLRGFFTAPAESWLWGDRHAAARASLPWHPEMTLLPGFVLYGLAVAGLVFSIWRVRTRLLLAAGVLVSIALAMGSRLLGGGRPGYLTLYDLLPGWAGIRTPGRLVLWTTLLLGLLAAGAVSAFVDRARELTVDRVPPRPGVLLRLATLVPLVLVLVEGVNRTPHPDVPTAPVALKSYAGPILVLPTDQPIDQNVMLWSTNGFPKIVNGSSGFIPEGMRRTRETTATFPDEASIAYLRELGVKTVILVKSRVGGTPWADAATVPVDGLDVTREEQGNVVVFHLD